MSRKYFSFKYIILYSFLSLFLLFLLEGILVYSVTKRNNRETKIVQTLDSNFEENGIYTKFDLVHKCTSKEYIKDSFYEIQIVNATDADFYNWEISIPLQTSINLNKTVNAKASLEGNTLHIVSNSDKNKILKANSTSYIEMYVTHKDMLIFDTVILSGNIVRHIGSCPLHIIIVVIGSIIILSMIIYSLVYSSMRREISVLNRITERSYAIIDQTMKTFVNFIDAKDQYTRGHSTRVAEYSKAIAKRMGYDAQFQQDMYYMGLMHDIGKITVPDTILNKTSHLTPDEWAVIQLHTQNGANLLRNFTIIPEIKDAVLYHHERYDGKGYLEGLKGEEIPLSARIICVADSYDAMNTNRCYRVKYSKERIIKEFERCSARQFDPTIASIMIELISDGTV